MVVKSPLAFTRVSTLSYHLTFVVALVPAAVAAIALHGLGTALSLTASVAGTWLGDLALRARTRGQEPQDWSAPVWGLLLGLLLPASAPFYLGLIGGLFATLVVKGLLGGGVTPWLNPVLAAWAFLQVGWPGAFGPWPEPAAPSGVDLQITEALNNNLFSWLSIQLPPGYIDRLSGLTSPAAAPAAASAGLWILGATIVVLGRGFLPWEVPAAFFLSFALPTLVVGGDALGQLFTGSLLLNLFFLASDPSSRPLGRLSLVVFAAGAGFLAFLIRTWGLQTDGIGYAVLFLNLLVPWLDRSLGRKPLNDFRLA